MRCRNITAGTVLAHLAALPEMPGKPFGKKAHELTMEECLRIDGRARRAARGPGRTAMSPAQLVAYSSKRQRARQTHPGKRP